MEAMYQRGKIREESLYYETRKHDGSLPIVGVNTYLSAADASEEHKGAALIRSSEEEKQDQVAAVRAFQTRNAPRAPVALSALQQAARRGRFFAGGPTEQPQDIGLLGHLLRVRSGAFRL